MNYVARTIDRIGGERAVDLRAGPIRAAKVAGFTDLASRVNSGIYLLCLRGEVVRICKVRKNFNEVVAGLRQRPAVLSAEFDQVLIRPIHPDDIDREYAELISELGL